MANLISYFDTINAYVSPDKIEGEPVFWLEMLNYGEVFGFQGEDADWPKRVYAGAFKQKGQMVAMSLDNLPAQVHSKQLSTNIGAKLDAVDVIKFQRKVDSLHKHDATVIGAATSSKDYFFQLVWAGLGVTDAFLSQGKQPTDLGAVRAFFDTLLAGPLSKMLDPNKYRHYEGWGFKAYFPRPGLILQEERTWLSITDGVDPDGTTKNIDTRKIKPITSQVTSQSPFASFLEMIDDYTKEEAKGGPEPLSKAEIKRRLHSSLKSLSCYAFRGDTRPPQEIKETWGGFFTPLTLNLKEKGSFYLKDYSGKDRQVSVADPKNPKWVGQKATTVEAVQQYLSKPDTFMAMMLHLANIGNYTANETYKPYISTTLSIAIAKCFANSFVKNADPKPAMVETYCYALRCKAGYRLPSTVKIKFRGDTPNNADVQKALKEKHTFANYAEQEVVVPIGIPWQKDVIGWRLVRSNKCGQFLAGPVMLRESLEKEDEASFMQLFELLSGKSQGKDLTIRPSYKPEAGYTFVPTSTNDGKSE